MYPSNVLRAGALAAAVAVSCLLTSAYKANAQAPSDLLRNLTQGKASGTSQQGTSSRERSAEEQRSSSLAREIIEGRTPAELQERWKSKYGSTVAASSPQRGRVIDNDRLELPPFSKARVTLRSYCLDRPLPAPASGEKMHLIEVSRLLSGDFLPVFEKLMSYSALHPEKSRQIQRIVWVMRFLSEATYVPSFDLVPEDKRLLEEISPGSVEVIENQKRKIQVQREMSKAMDALLDKALPGEVKGVLGQLSRSGYDMNRAPRDLRTADEMVGRTLAIINGMTPTGEIPKDNSEYTLLSDDLAVKTEHPGGASGTRLLVANPTPEAKTMNFKRYAIQSPRNTQRLGIGGIERVEWPEAGAGPNVGSPAAGGGIREVLSPVVGDLEVIHPKEHPNEKCTGTKWCFNQHKSRASDDPKDPRYKIGHIPWGGINGADDTYAWDVNLYKPGEDDLDRGKPVYAVARGRVTTTFADATNAGGSCGQLLIEHETKGIKWWSGYLHLEMIIPEKQIQVKIGDTVEENTVLGYIGTTCASNYHLHFAVYTNTNTRGGLVSFDAKIIPRNSLQSERASVSPPASVSVAGATSVVDANLAKQVMDYALLSQAAYKTRAGYACYAPINGWESITVLTKIKIKFDLSMDVTSVFNKSPLDLTTAGSTPATAGFASGFYAQAFRKNGNVIIAFRGTDDWSDWKTDIQAFLGGKPEQYQEALDFVARVRNDCQSVASITLTGHSLGGGLASYAALFYKMPATIFNAAGLKGALKANVEKNLDVQNIVQNIDVDGDPVSALGGQVGKVYRLEIPASWIGKNGWIDARNLTTGLPPMLRTDPPKPMNPNPLAYHSMETVTNALNVLIK